MTRVLVLGGTGFVGRRVCELLQAGGHHVTVPTRATERARRQGEQVWAQLAQTQRKQVWRCCGPAWSSAARTSS